LATAYTEGTRGATDERSVIRRFAEETKPSIKTTELLVLLLAVAGVLVASSQDDSLDGRWAWTLVAALAIGYMLSRGLAKSGSGYAGED
jgi:hypothetical protein